MARHLSVMLFLSREVITLPISVEMDLGSRTSITSGVESIVTPTGPIEIYETDVIDHLLTHSTT